MLRQLLGQGQTDQPHVSHHKRAVKNGVMSFILSLPWFIAYFVIFNELDDQCKGNVYQFAKFARWAYLGSSIAHLVLFPLKLKEAKDRDLGEKTLFGRLYLTLAWAHAFFKYGIWIYACVALTDRDNCQSDTLTSLLWVNVLFPAILLGLIFCCCCCLAVITGTVAGTARYLGSREQPRENNTNRATEMNQLQKELEEERRKLEMKIAENLNIDRDDMP